MRKRNTEEEKIAINIGKVVSDLRLDLEMVGFYVAHYLPNVSYRRLLIILDAAEDIKMSEGKGIIEL
jgi:hypothetical protein